MKTSEVRCYYDMLVGKKSSLVVKRMFDIFTSLVLIILLSPVILLIAILIKIDSPGPVLYRQERVTQYGRIFRVCKFRTMINNADKIGVHITTDSDARITKIGSKIRNSRLDEIPQLFNILAGTMSFVGTRPEAVRYVESYTHEMMATLLLPAGVTSKASIEYKDEAELLRGVSDVESFYIEKILPEKMKYNLESIARFSLIEELKILVKTVVAVL
ncbi:sugar transferase [Anaerovoracaceae bacterium SGI.195]